MRGVRWSSTALGTDHTKLAVVEERDGWGHTKHAGIRVLSAETGSTLVFYPTVATIVPMHDEAQVARGRVQFEALLALANDALAQDDWRPLLQTILKSEDSVRTESVGQRRPSLGRKRNRSRG